MGIDQLHGRWLGQGYTYRGPVTMGYRYGTGTELNMYLHTLCMY